ncbi:MAG: hypothetical protein AAGA23_18205 [Pseudomonadota bacterium]
MKASPVLVAGVLFSALLSRPLGAQPALEIDLAVTRDDPDVLTRVYGSVGDGDAGLPVAGGFDMNGDGFPDYAFAAFRADVGGLIQAGQVFLVLGNGSISGSVDTAQADTRVLPILGTQTSEHTGSEIWMDDVTGDGLGDLLICRQDHTPVAGRIGAGALTILAGSSNLSALAAGSSLDLSAPPTDITLFTIVGTDVQDRLCMWARTGDLTEDGIADITVGADQFGPGDSHRGRVYVVRGGPLLAQNATADLALAADPGFVLAGHLAQISAPGTATHTHFGATVQMADLDGNGRTEVLAAAALNRAGGSFGPSPRPEVAHGFGGAAGGGTLYIFWDNNFPTGAWPSPFILDPAALPGDSSSINGTSINSVFGEEVLGGLDYNNDGEADLFVGDLTGDPPGRGDAGVGHVLYSANRLRNQNFDLDAPPAGLVESRIYGPIPGAIGADTAMHGDFDGDGTDDLAFSSPHDRPFDRFNAGTIHVLFGDDTGWPALIDLAPGALPSTAELRMTEVYGANGQIGSDTGDTLAYSGAAGDINNDGRTDILTNEMVGNGLAPGTIDVGNLIILSGTVLSEPLFQDSFETP